MPDVLTASLTEAYYVAHSNAIVAVTLFRSHCLMSLLMFTHAKVLQFPDICKFFLLFNITLTHWCYSVKRVKIIAENLVITGIIRTFAVGKQCSTWWTSSHAKFLCSLNHIVSINPHLTFFKAFNFRLNFFFCIFAPQDFNY